ncbi:Hydrogenase maturation protease [Minicystis rosea]|nr:Hydrogenase maturation protease [Minicystis rosea]
MSERVLVACLGNVFFRDDGFGVEVARRLAAGPLPPGVAVVDYGIRGLHLAFALLDPHALVIVVDAVTRGGAPGSLYVIEPDEVDDRSAARAEAHGMSFPVVLAMVAAMGGTPPRMLLVGCEPASVDEGMGLSELVEPAVDEAVAIVRDLLTKSAAPCAPREEVEP